PVLSLTSRAPDRPPPPPWRAWLAFSPDGGRLPAVSSDGWVQGWACAGGKEAFAFRAGTAQGPSSARAQALAPCGGYLAPAGTGGLVVGHAATGKKVQSIAEVGFEDGNTLAYSPDGRHLVGVTPASVRREAGVLVPQRPAAVKVWDVATGKEVFALAAPGARFRSVAFSPDG